MEWLARSQDLPGLVNVHITMENHHFLMGKLTISMAIFNSYVKLPEGMRLCMFMYVYVNHIQSSAVDLLVLRVLFSK